MELNRQVPQLRVVLHAVLSHDMVAAVFGHEGLDLSDQLLLHRSQRSARARGSTRGSDPGFRRASTFHRPDCPRACCIVRPVRTYISMGKTYSNVYRVTTMNIPL